MIWTRDELSILRVNYTRGTPIPIIARLVHRNKHAVIMKARRLGLRWLGSRRERRGGGAKRAVPQVPVPVTLTFDEEKALRKAPKKRPSHNTSRFTQRAVLPGPESLKIPITITDPPKTKPTLWDECNCSEATGSGVVNAQGYTICLKCRLPRKRL